MVYFPNELAPWERRSEHYNMVNLGKNVERQNELINEGFNEMLSSQFSCANSIVASQEITQELLSQGFNGVVQGINYINEGIDGLKSAFEFGISEVVWQIEQNREFLKNILSVLSSPLDTQAKELRKRAEEAYSNGWIDDALEDFLASEIKNKYDFTIHISLGMIYLFHKLDKKKALEYFDKAIKYSKPKSRYHASFALLHKASIHRSFGEFDKADESASEASSLSPDFSEAVYQNALYRALVGKDISILESAIKIDPKYLLKAWEEDVFNSNKKQLEEITIKFRNQESKKFNLNKTKVVDIIIEFNHRIENFDKTERMYKLNHKFKRDNIDLIVKNIYSKLEEIEKRNSFFDYYIFNNEHKSALENINKEICNFKNHINKIIKLKTSKRDVIMSTRSEKAGNKYNNIKSIATIGIGVILAFFVGVYKWYNTIMYEEAYSQYFGFKGKPWEGNLGTTILAGSLLLAFLFYIYDFIMSKKCRKESKDEISIDATINKLNEIIVGL